MIAQQELLAIAARIRLLVLDVDGVLTDGRLWYDAEGREIKSFHVRDGYGIQQLQAAGIPVAVISGRSSPAAAARLAELRVSHVFLGRNDKKAVLDKLLTELEAQVDSPEEFEKLGELMYSPDDKGMDKLNDLYKKVTSLPSRIDSAKKLGETLKVLIALEREAYGVDKEVKQDTGLTGESIATLKKLKAALENAD